MLSGVHILLSYKCTYECDHCFIYCSPYVNGTFTIEKIRDLLNQCKETKTVNSIYFEGGEPFLFYQLMLAGIKKAKALGFSVGIVSNAYWATSEESALLWLKPLIDLEISDLSISADSFHGDDEASQYANNAINVAKRIGIPSGSICIDPPSLSDDTEGRKGEMVVGGDVMFKGRAVEKLIDDLPTKNISNFKTCPHEDFVNPGRVHIDAYGEVHICQGISVGNVWQTPLPELMANYDPHQHPICGPIIKGGPFELINKYEQNNGTEYIDECHACYIARKNLLADFPQYLTPKQVYGVEK